jgi:hypothetical protein
VNKRKDSKIESRQRQRQGDEPVICDGRALACGACNSRGCRRSRGGSGIYFFSFLVTARRLAFFKRSSVGGLEFSIRRRTRFRRRAWQRLGDARVGLEDYELIVVEIAGEDR